MNCKFHHKYLLQHRTIQYLEGLHRYSKYRQRCKQTAKLYQGCHYFFVAQPKRQKLVSKHGRSKENLAKSSVIILQILNTISTTWLKICTSYLRTCGAQKLPSIICRSKIQFLRLVYLYSYRISSTGFPLV